MGVIKFRKRWGRNILQCLACCVKFCTFVFWASLCLMAMKLTLFRSSAPVVKDWSYLPDNYTKWLLQGPILGGDYPEVDYENLEIDYATTDEELSKRAATVMEVCAKRGLNDQQINSKEFFVDHKHNLVWCNVFKAASSFWLYKFNILGGYDKKFLSKSRYTPLTLARRKFARPSEEELRDAISNPGVVSLLVVREPFVRLLSAYRDKLENITPPFYRKIAKAIIAKHRKKATNTLGPIRSFGPTFYEFVAYLIENHRTKNVDFDEHWSPYYQFCTPCAANFSVIAKVETLARDSAYVIQQIGVAHLLNSKATTDRRTRLRKIINKSKDGRNTTTLLRHYFKQIDDKMLTDLLEIYGTDFEMFGYDSEVYRTYVRKELK
ncbi:sulfotransferase family domain-containing protein [Phthorimaea operculella]|nr:sulfotransferase family domain-containing protein [Phthorimaea operculella]